MAKYNIENIKIAKEDSDFYINIQGWTYCNSEDNIEIYMDNNIVKTAQIDAIFRQDVNEYLQIDDNISRGFQIKVKIKGKTLKLVFKNEANQEEFLIQDLKKRINKYKRERSILNHVNKYNLNKLVLNIKTIGFKATIKKVIYKLNKSQEQQENIKPYVYNYKYEEVDIPQEWLDIQKNKPNIGVIIEVNEWQEEFAIAIESLDKQIYNQFKVLFVLKNESLEQIIKDRLQQVNFEHKCIIKQDIKENIQDWDYLVSYCLDDILCKTSFAHIMEYINISMEPDIVYGDYDFVEEEQYHTRISKKDIPLNQLKEKVITRGLYAVKKDIYCAYDLEHYLRDFPLEKWNICYINKVLVHKRLIKSQNSSVKAIAFYLPQFHCIPENDKYWGKGFTEWTNVRRAVPMFEGHNQPRTPGKLGYYNLVENKDIQYQQAQLAKEYNVYGLCYYYYWFNGKRLLEKPLENLMKNKNIDLPFCVCWANENWTKRWDGMQHEIIIEQVHEQDSDERFIKDIIEIIKDERYIRINNKPLILIYKVQLLHDGKQTIKKWRETVKEYGIDDIYVAIVKHTGVTSPEQYGADAMIEFPPHDVNANNISSATHNMVSDFSGNIYDYSELANRDLTWYDYTMFRGCMLQWDNTARRMQKAFIFDNFSPEDYKRWLLRIKEYAMLFNNKDEQIIFINAWNEWAEGTYLEPDEKYGDTFLKITKEVLESR